MLSLDLFNTKYERELREGAVDDLEARRIDILNDRMQDLLGRAKESHYKNNPAALAGLKKEYQKFKDERDSYYKVREAGIPGNIPTEKIPGKEDLLKGKGRSYYEADQKKNSEQVDEYISMGSDKNYQEAEPYKNYRIYVRKKPFGATGMYTAHTEIDRKEFMGKGSSQEEAVQAIQDRIDFVLNAQKKVTGSSTIDFNVKFATDLLADPRQTFYAKLENINGEPKLVIASAEVASDPELLAAGDFKRSALRNQPDDSGRATPLPGIPLTAKGLRSGDWIANGRYTVGRETSDQDGNRVFDLTYHSTAHTKSDKLRLNQPAFTLGTSREVDEHGGGIGPRQHWQDLMPEQSNPEDYGDYEDEDQETELRSGDYVRDTMDGEHGEVFRMQGDPYERRVRILDRDGKGWYIEPSRLTRVDPQDPDVQRYFGKRRQRDMDESSLEEISRRDFLKGAGATAGLAAMGAPKDAKADWFPGQHTDNLTGGKIGFLNNFSIENPNIQLSMRNWSNLGGYVLVMLGFPKVPLTGNVVSFGNMEGIKIGVSAMVGNKVFRGLDGILIPSTDSTMLLLGVQNKFNAPLFKSIIDSYDDNKGSSDIAVEVGAKVYHFKGRAAQQGEWSPAPMREEESVDETASPDAVAEGWSDAMVARRTGGPRTPYAVYIKGKKWKDFENEDHARAVMDKLKAKFKADGRDPETVTIAPTDMTEGLKSTLAGAALAGAMALGGAGAAQAQSAAGGSSMPNATTIIQQIQAGKIQNQNDLSAALGDNQSIRQFVFKQLQAKAGLSGHGADSVINALAKKSTAGAQQPVKSAGQSGSIVQRPTDNFESRIKEEQDSSGVERAILNRIMVAHTDLLMKFGPDKVMQAAEEVAYNVGDVDEIGTSDVSAYVAQVKQILGATP
jgi:hypothetical protein